MRTRQYIQTYDVWKSMKRRCTNPSASDFARYGAKGISVCERWATSFKTFLADMGLKPDGYSIDRIDGNGNYEPANCRWVPLAKQNSNKRTNHVIEFAGKTMTLSDWAREIGTSQAVLSWRICTAKWPIERALTQPVIPRKGASK